MNLELNNKVMLVNLSISTFTGEKVDRRVTDQVAASHNTHAREAGKYQKQIIARHSLEGIHKVAGAARTVHYRRTLPWNDLGGRLLSVTGYFDYMNEIRNLKSSFNEEIRIFAKVYPDLIEQARTRLNGMFDIDDYPPIDELLQRFEFSIAASPLPSGQNWFLELAADELGELRAAADERLQASVETAVKDVYRRVADVTERMVDRLRSYETDPETGKCVGGVFRDSIVSNVSDLVDILPSLNITGDPKLAQLAADMKELTRFNAGALRSEPTFRKATADKAEAIFNTVKGLFG